MGTLDGVGTRDAAQVDGCEQEHPDIHHARQGQRHNHVPPGGAEQSFGVGGAHRHPVTVAGERGMDVDRVGHHGRAEHTGGEKHGVGAVEARDESLEHFAGVGRVDRKPREEADADDGEHPDDDGFERTLPEPVLQAEQSHGDRADDDAAEQQGQVEKQVESDRSPDDLGEVGGDGDEFGLGPKRPSRARTQALAKQFGQGATADESEFGGLVLHQPGHEVRSDQYPDEKVAEPRTSREVGRDVTRVDIGDRSDEGGAEQEDSTGTNHRRTRFFRHTEILDLPPAARHPVSSASGESASGAPLWAHD